MFNSWKGLFGFLVGLALTVGLLLTPHLVPGGRGYRMGLGWTPVQIAGVLAAGLSVLAATLWIGGLLVKDARDWKQPKVIAAAVMIALVANTLYMFLVEWFALAAGARALVAVLGVPVIYGNLVRVLGKRTLGQAMAEIAAGALATMGAGFIIAALLRAW